MTKSKIAFKKQLEETLKKSVPHSFAQYSQFIETCEKLLVSSSISVKSYATCEKLTFGAHNNVYKLTDASGKEYVLRITIKGVKDANGSEFKGMHDEALLNINLASLDIVPTIHEVYFAMNKKKEYVLCIISDYASEGSLTHFLNTNAFKCMSSDDITYLAKRTRNLYQKMVYKDIFCVDVKSDNAVVSKGKVRELVPYLIDFDTVFCSSPLSFVKMKDIMSTVNDKKGAYYIPKASIPLVREAYFAFMLVQVACYIQRYIVPEATNKKKKVKFFITELLGEIKPRAIQNMSKILEMSIGNGDLDPFYMLEHYFSFQEYAQGSNQNLLKIEEAASNSSWVFETLYAYALYGEPAIRKIIKKLK